MRWQLILEQFSPELIYIKGSKNIVVDARSRLDIIDNLNNTNTYSNNNNDKKFEPTLESLSENFVLNKEDVLHSSSFKTIMRFQQKDKSLKTTPLNNFMGQVRCIFLSIDTEKI